MRSAKSLSSQQNKNGNNAAMEKQSRLLHGSKRSLQPLATISEDIGETRQKRFIQSERREEEFGEQVQCNDICQDCKNKRAKEYNELLSESTHCLNLKTLPEDMELQTEPRLRKSSPVVSGIGDSKDANVAKILFPEFFPRDPAHGHNSDSGLWAIKLTMEEVFSGRIRSVRVSENLGLHQQASFEYWKQYQLSF